MRLRKVGDGVVVVAAGLENEDEDEVLGPRNWSGAGGVSRTRKDGGGSV